MYLKLIKLKHKINAHTHADPSMPNELTTVWQRLPGPAARPRLRKRQPLPVSQLRCARTEGIQQDASLCLEGQAFLIPLPKIVAVIFSTLVITCFNPIPPLVPLGLDTSAGGAAGWSAVCTAASIRSTQRCSLVHRGCRASPTRKNERGETGFDSYLPFILLK